MADNDLVDTGVLVREGVLEDSLVVLGLRCDIEEERFRGRGGWERKGMGREREEEPKPEVREQKEQEEGRRRTGGGEVV